MFSRIRIDSMPMRMIQMLTPQKSRKQASCATLMPSGVGGICSIDGTKTATIL